MLGQFTVHVDGRSISHDMWPGRRSAELIQLLALAPGHRLARDQVMEAMWPHLEADAAAANLRKAAHHARRTLGANDAVVLRQGAVALFPSARVRTDLTELEAGAREALDQGDVPACRRLIERFPGELLPDSLYEEWTQSARRRLQTTRIALIKSAGMWERLIELDPTDESAYRELMREALEEGNRARSIQWYGRLRMALARELSVDPGLETQALYRRALSGLAETPLDFVGRQEALAVTASALGSPDRSVRGIVVRGETGIGKTRLAAEMSALARADGWTTFTASCVRSEAPYRPLVSLVEQVISSGSRVPEGARETFSMIVSGRVDEGRHLGRHRVAGALESILASVDGNRVLVVIDDVHLADEATIDVLLRELALDSLPVGLLVLTYERRDAPSSLKEGLGALKRRGRSTEIELAPLSDEHTRTLIRLVAGSSPPEETMERAVELAQGNPAVAVELARSIDAGGRLRVTSEVWDAAVTWTEAFDRASLALTERLAVAGGWLSTDEILAITGLDPDDCYRLLDRLMVEGILEVADGRYRFRRELVRRALCNRVPPHRRVSIHRDVARCLQSLTIVPAQRVAEHWLEGGRPEKAIPWLLDAARSAAHVGAMAEALAHAEEILRFEPSDPDALALKADSLAALGRVEAVAAYAEAAASVGPKERHELRARLALTQLKSGDPRGALQTLETATPVTLGGRIAEALTLSGAAAIGFGDPAVAAEKAHHARRLALEEGDPGTVVEASWALSLAAHARGELRSMIRSELASTSELGDLAIRVFDGYLCATERLLYGSIPYDEIVEFASSLRAEAERLGAIRGQGFALTLAGEARLLAGHLDAATSDLERAADLNRSIGATAGEALALQRRADVDRYLGRPEEARPWLARALLVARESYLGHHLFDRIYGAMIASEEDPSYAVHIVEEAESAVVGPLETCPACRITFEVPAAIASARSGDLARAARHLEAVDMLSTVMVPQPGWHAAASEARGHVDLARGETRAAGARFARAAELYHSAGQPLDAARCRAIGAI